ncbi:MAG: cation diffusion facilitator family transporter, partial [Gammaproteobacteria bacterium]|nr:cation diffusion facilitator family transporter [Gammaproteobacteria bacterium]
VASVAIVVNELLFRYTLLVANRIDSNLLKANAWHKRSDALSSIVVLIGISAERMGVPHFDAVAAIVVALMIMYQGVKWIWAAIQELIDVGVRPDFLAEIKETILDVDGVMAVHGLRTRKSGSEIYLEAHVQVDEKTSASEGHFIADWVQRAVIRKFPKIIDVMVHVDVVDDLYVHEGILLPNRNELMQTLEPAWKELPSYAYLRVMTLHYLGNEIAIELVFPLSVLNNLQEASLLFNQYKESIQPFQYIRSIHIFFAAD